MSCPFLTSAMAFVCSSSICTTSGDAGELDSTVTVTLLVFVERRHVSIYYTVQYTRPHFRSSMITFPYPSKGGSLFRVQDVTAKVPDVVDGLMC